MVSNLAAENERLREAADAAWDWAEWSRGTQPIGVVAAHSNVHDDRERAINEIIELLRDALDQTKEPISG
jgi:hypothetical protein